MPLSSHHMLFRLDQILRKRSGTRTKSRVLSSKVAIVLFTLFLVGSADAAYAADKKVLILYADKSTGAMMAYRETFQSVLNQGSKDHITLYEEYMDLWQNSSEEYLSLLRGYYAQKYRDQRFDLIVTQAPSVLKFISNYGEELFPGTPTVFGTMDKRRIEEIDLRPNMTGVLEDFGFVRTVELALQLHPGLRKVFVVSGSADADKRYLAVTRRELDQVKDRVEVEYLLDLTMEELEQRLSQLPEHSITFFVTFVRDKNGKPFIQLDAASRVSKASSVPTYCLVDRFVEVGAFGGYVFSLEADASAAAKVALRVLAGEKPQDIPIQVADSNRYMFDWRQLKQWRIDEGSLPQGSILRFKQLTFWELHKWKAVAALSLFILQALLIVVLLINRAKRLRAEKETTRFAAEVEAEHERLEEVVRNVPGIVWESRLEQSTNSLQSIFVSPYVESMLGYTTEQWLSVPDFPLTITHKDDQESFVRETAAILSSGSEGVLRFRWTAMDGRVLWVEAHVAVIRDELGNTIGLRGVTMDITERKRDEEVLQKLSGRLLTLRDEEQRRVAAELHDGLGQSLAIIKNRALIGMRDKANEVQIMEQFKEIAATATSSIFEVRSIAHNLRPYELDRLGLVAAIESMIHRISDSTSIKFSSDFEPIEGLLSPEAETSVYRIIQEGVNNVVRHSHADSARVEIKNTLKQVTISVFDNGHGIVRSAPTNGNKVGGFGLAGIAERVRQLGGSLYIDSQPGSGTTVTIRLELQSVVTT